MIRLEILCCLLFFSITLEAQQNPVSTQFWNTYLHNNPAVAGMQYRHEAHALHRNQWDMINGAPNTVFVNYSARVKALHGGLGISYSYNGSDYNKQNTMLADYAFHLSIGENMLSFGVSAGAESLSNAPYWLPPVTITDPVPASSGNSTQFTLNTGVAFHALNWNAGFSVTQLNQPSFRFSNAIYKEVPYYWLFADYTFPVTKFLSLRPQTQIYTDGVKMGYSVSVLGIIRQNGWVGLSFSHNSYVGILGGFDFKGKYRIGYGYYLMLNQQGSVSRGTHEMVLGYLLK